MSNLLTEESRRAKERLAQERQSRNSQRRISDAGGTVAEVAKTAASNLRRGLGATLNFLDKPRNTGAVVADQLGKNMNKRKDDDGSLARAAYDGFTQKNVRMGSDTLKDLGVKNKTGQLVGGLALDMATDPLTYGTFGAGSFAKGLVTGTKSTLGKEAIEAAGRRAAAQSGRLVKKELLKTHNVTNIDSLATKLGGTKDDAYNMINKKAFGTDFDDAQRAIPNGTSYQIYQAASKAYAEKAGRKYAADQLKMAGKGTTYMGKTFKTGAQLQDAGAQLADELRSLPVVGKVMDGVADKVAPMFSTKPRGIGINSQEASILKNISSSTESKKALKDIAAEKTAKSLAVLSSGLKFQGRPLDEMIDTIVAKNGAGLTKADLDTVITTDARRKFAAKQLAENQTKSAGHIIDPDNMTLGQYLNVYSRLYKGMAIDESREGLLKLGDAAQWRNADIASDIAAGKKTSDQYLPRVRDAAGKAFKVRGGRSGGLAVSNVYAKARNDVHAGLSVPEINQNVTNSAYMKGIGAPSDAKFLEESQVRAFVSRKLSSNKILADKEFVDDVIATFGERLPRDLTPADIEAYRQSGMAIVAPKQAYNLLSFKDDVVKQLAESFDKKAGKQVTRTEQSAKILNDLTSDEAMNLLVSSAGRSPLYAIPIGAMEHVNMSAGKQIDEGIRQMTSLMGKFNKLWKPMVTGMRFAYHTRNIASSEFNNFLDLGMKMFDGDVQKMSAATAIIGRGTNHIVDPMINELKNVSIDIGGKKWTAQQIHDKMVETGALNTFMLTDSSTLGQSILNDVNNVMDGGLFARAFSSINPLKAVPNTLKAWAGAGKIAGNTIEEFVRTTSFVANMKKGLSPQQAAEMVNKIHFDYQDLTEFEQSLKSTAMPFYTWMRKNIPLQFESFLNDPRIYQGFNRAKDEGANVYDIDYSQVPQYIQENFGIPVGYNKEGRLTILDAGLPLSDLSTGWKDIVTGMGPWVKAAVELTTNQSLLTGAPIDSTGYDASIKIIQDYFGGNPPKEVQDFLMSPNGSQLAKVLTYAKSNMGVFRDIGPNTKISDVAPENQVVQQGRNYSHAKSDVAKQFLSQLDPNFLKYYSPSAAQRSADFDTQNNLDNTLQAMKKLGYNVRTMNEIKP